MLYFIFFLSLYMILQCRRSVKRLRSRGEESTFWYEFCTKNLPPLWAVFSVAGLFIVADALGASGGVPIYHLEPLAVFFATLSDVAKMMTPSFFLCFGILAFLMVVGIIGILPGKDQDDMHRMGLRSLSQFTTRVFCKYMKTVKLLTFVLSLICSVALPHQHWVELGTRFTQQSREAEEQIREATLKYRTHVSNLCIVDRVRESIRVAPHPVRGVIREWSDSRKLEQEYNSMTSQEKRLKSLDERFRKTESSVGKEFHSSLLREHKNNYPSKEISRIIQEELNTRTLRELGRISESVSKFEKASSDMVTRLCNPSDQRLRVGTEKAISDLLNLEARKQLTQRTIRAGLHAFEGEALSLILNDSPVGKMLIEVVGKPLNSRLARLADNRLTELMRTALQHRDPDDVEAVLEEGLRSNTTKTSFEVERRWGRITSKESFALEIQAIHSELEVRSFQLKTKMLESRDLTANHRDRRRVSRGHNLVEEEPRGVSVNGDEKKVIKKPSSRVRKSKRFKGR